MPSHVCIFWIISTVLLSLPTKGMNAQFMNYGSDFILFFNSAKCKFFCSQQHYLVSWGQKLYSIACWYAVSYGQATPLQAFIYDWFGILVISDREMNTALDANPTNVPYIVVQTIRHHCSYRTVGMPT